jgi:UDP-2-acetamido-3-amino-2,3-dideoxy-glucuronate N-acetyltransferase
VASSTVGARTRISQFANVVRGTVLGEDCRVWPFVNLDGPTFGNRCIVCSGVAMGPGFRFGDDCFIGPNVTICNDAWPRYDKNGFDADSLRGGLLAVYVGNSVSIGANAVVLPGVVIGFGSMIAAGAVVERSVPVNHLLRRDGSMVEIDPEWRERRMRFC